MSNTNVTVTLPEQKTVPQTPIAELVHHVRPAAVLAFGLITTVAWIGLLGYVLIKLL